MTLFRKNPRFEREMDKQPETIAARKTAARVAAGIAAGLSPRGASGNTAGSFVVTEDGDQVYLGNTDFAFHMTEFGSVNNPPYAPLRRAVRAAGLRLEETGK